MIALPLQLNENPVWYLSLESQFKVEKESSLSVLWYITNCLKKISK